MKKKHIILKATLILVTLIALFLFFELVIYRILAVKKVKAYISQQGATEQDVESMSIYWDPLKNGGYTIHVKFKDDPEYEYHYNYRLLNNLEFDNKVRFSTSKNGFTRTEGGKYKNLDWYKYIR